MNTSIRLMFLMLVLMQSLVGVSQGAEIYYSEPEELKDGWVTQSQIRIEGTVQKGDYEKLRQLVLTKENNGVVFINSDGGDVREAMKIGALIRGAHISISVIDKCNSACFIIYSSAVERSHNGASFGLHRPFYEKEKYKLLSPMIAQEAYADLEQGFKSYLLKNRVPIYAVDKLMMLSSNDAWVVRGEEMERLIGRKDAAYEELLIAKCGSLSESEAADLERMSPLFQDPRLSCKEVSAGLNAMRFSVGYCDFLRTRNREILNCEWDTAENARSSYVNKLKVLHIE
jgi:hypothetical protein